MPKYAKDTTVSTSNSLNEIDRIVERWGASQFLYAKDEKQVTVMFTMNNRRIKLSVPLPCKDDNAFKKIRGGSLVTNEFSPDKYDQAVRQRYRALVLCIKAKLESVDSGIETFEDAFLAHIVLPDGGTVGQVLKPQIEQAYLTGKMPPLLGTGA